MEGDAVTTKFKPTIKEQFYAFHASNHEVADELALLAFDLQNKGHKRGGMKMLFEVLRWQRMMKTNDPFSEFKLNNNYTSHYARMLTRCYPRLEGFFETRQMRSP